jgi:hypothetical protein
MLAVVASVGHSVFENIKDRKAGNVLTPVFSLPHFMGISAKGPFKTGLFMTDAKAFLIGQTGIALLLFATGLHLNHLRSQELGAEQLKRVGLNAEQMAGGVGEDSAPQP